MPWVYFDLKSWSIPSIYLFSSSIKKISKAFFNNLFVHAPIIKWCGRMQELITPDKVFCKQRPVDFKNVCNVKYHANRSLIGIWRISSSSWRYSQSVGFVLLSASEGIPNPSKDFGAIFALIAELPTIHLIVSMDSCSGLLHHVHVKSGLLNGYPMKIIYMKPPLGFRTCFGVFWVSLCEPREMSNLQFASDLDAAEVLILEVRSGLKNQVQARMLESEDARCSEEEEVCCRMKLRQSFTPMTCKKRTPYQWDSSTVRVRRV